MSKKETMPLNADTANAIVDALGALTMCMSRQLNPAQRTAFKADMEKIAVLAEKNGNTTLETLLIDLRNAAKD